MVPQQLQLLSILSQSDERQAYVKWTIEGITEKHIIELQDKGLVFVSLGDGFIGSLQTLSLTTEGDDFIKDYCDACECMPCDCDWGQP